jgi:hypothetical protein
LELGLEFGPAVPCGPAGTVEEHAENNTVTITKARLLARRLPLIAQRISGTPRSD